MGQGHRVDGDTLALWGLNERHDDTRATTEPDSGGSNLSLGLPTGAGVPGITDFTPIAGSFCRLFVRSPHDATAGLCFGRETSISSQELWIGSWTVACFIRVDELPAGGLWDPIVGHNGSVSSSAAAHNCLGRVDLGDDGRLRVFWEHAGGLGVSVEQTSGATLVVGAWHHVAITRDAVARHVQFFLDGNLEQTVSFDDDPDTGSSGGWFVGRDGATPTRHLSAAVRDIHVCRGVRSGAEIALDAATIATTGQQTPGANTFALWRLDQVPVVLDSGPLKLHMKSAGSSPTINITVPTGDGGLIADDGCGRILLNASLAAHYTANVRNSLLSNFTFEGWFLLLLRSQPGFVHGLFCHGDAGTEPPANNYFAAIVDETGTVTVDFEHGGGSSSDSTVNSTVGAVPFGVSVHIAVRKRMTNPTWTGDIFVNGVNVTAQPNTDRTNGDGSNNSAACFFTIGRGQTSANQFNGVIDDVRLSSVARTDAEILESYERGRGLIKPIIIEVNPPDLSTISVDDTVSLAVIDPDSGLERVTIAVTYGPDYVGGSTTELVYDNGFTNAYIAASIAGPIAGGLSFVLDRTAWPSANLAFTVRAEDKDGNQETASFSYTTT